MDYCKKHEHDGDFDDLNVNADICQLGESHISESVKIEDDEVFLTREMACDEMENSLLIQLKRSQVQHHPPPEFRQKSFCCPAQWSVTHRCFDCAWKKQRGNRPKHPLPPMSPGYSSPPMVTLQSLSTTRDSGYEPSPTSAFSFTFSDDEETDMNTDHKEKTTDISINFGHLGASTVTPPINIPSRTFEVTNFRSSRSSRVKSKCYGSKLNDPTQAIRNDEISNETSQEKSAVRKRSKSAPEFGGNELVLQRTPLIIRNTSCIRTPFSDKITPVHGRNYSLPVTTPDGRPLLAPPLSTPSSRASKEGLIDLAEEDPEGSAGHRRRVLVLALPDLIVDARRRPPMSPSEGSNSSTCISRESSGVSSVQQEFWLPVARNGSGGSEAADLPKPRPAWRRPRALSCDVTLEVEVGQGLRKIADNFSRDTIVEQEGGVWRQLHNSIFRRLSLGAITPVLETASNSSRESHSLPSSPSQPGYRSDSSDFDELADFSD